jgi:hypothetical protein
VFARINPLFLRASNGLSIAFQRCGNRFGGNQAADPEMRERTDSRDCAD